MGGEADSSHLAGVERLGGAEAVGSEGINQPSVPVDNVPILTNTDTASDSPTVAPLVPAGDSPAPSAGPAPEVGEFPTLQNME
jgi:hypothetical protein